MKLVVGLGNPGKKYEQTRHNIGFEALAEFARRRLADPPRAKFAGALSEANMLGEKILLLMPHTLMNRSGRSVGEAVDFYKIEAADVLTVCDDFHLPLGELRLRPRGSDGGQKGLADIHRRLGTTDVPRLRIGIGPTPEGWDAADFVLGRFTKEERPRVDEQVGRAAEAIEAWITEGIQAAMNRYNGKPD